MPRRTPIRSTRAESLAGKMATWSPESYLKQTDRGRENDTKEKSESGGKKNASSSRRPTRNRYIKIEDYVCREILGKMAALQLQSRRRPEKAKVHSHFTARSDQWNASRRRRHNHATLLLTLSTPQTTSAPTTNLNFDPVISISMCRQPRSPPMCSSRFAVIVARKGFLASNGLSNNTPTIQISNTFNISNFLSIFFQFYLDQIFPLWKNLSFFKKFKTKILANFLPFKFFPFGNLFSTLEDLFFSFIIFLMKKFGVCGRKCISHSGVWNFPCNLFSFLLQISPK